MKKAGNVTTLTVMQRIRAGLLKPHPAGEPDKDFVNAIYELFDEFDEAYESERLRIQDNDAVYHGKQWDAVPVPANDPNEPRPTTPLVHSTIENKKADAAKKVPSAIIKPDAFGSFVAAKVIEHGVNQDLVSCKFEREWNMASQDYYNCGWTPWEIGFDPKMNQGLGGAFIRNVANTNFMCDPECTDLQEGRAVFKIAGKPRDWFYQHFPDHVPYMSEDLDYTGVTETTGTLAVPKAKKDGFRLIEAWFRVYDPKKLKYTVHFVQVAGNTVLFNSADTHKDGYYAHGEYPFIIDRLFPEKGSALGFGLTDIFKEPQRYYDKMDQIVVKNALTASKNRLFVAKSSGFDVSDLRDWSKEVHEGDMIDGVKWETPPQMPGYLLQYIDRKGMMIKQESGTNDQSRGQGGSSITAASAITALQDMATKRSAMENALRYFTFSDAVRQMISVKLEFESKPRDVTVSIDGIDMHFEYSNKKIKLRELPVDADGNAIPQKSYAKVMKELSNNEMTKIPVEYLIDVKATRQEDYDKVALNETILSFVRLLGDRADPTIMLEAMDFDGKEQVLETIRRAQSGGMTQLMQQVEQLSQVVQQQAEALETYQATTTEQDALVNELGGALKAPQLQEQPMQAQMQAQAQIQQPQG